MNYRTLGSSGCSVSVLCLGTMTFGNETDENESFAQLDTFIEAGGNFIDTADVYTQGQSESIIGRWLKKTTPFQRDQVIIATKGRFPTGSGPNDAGLSRRHLTKAIDASLIRLGLETIDLYQVHAWDPWTPLEETLSCLNDAVSAGKIRYFGLSNFTGWQLQKTVDLSLNRHLDTPVTLQPQYNLLAREIEWEIIPACLENGVGLLPWSPLGGGWLTGKYKRDQIPTGSTRLGENPNRGVESYYRRSGQERTWDVLSAVEKASKNLNATMAQVSLAWLRDRPSVSSVILGCRNVEQLNDNLGAGDLLLDNDSIEELNLASDPGASDYPYGGPGNAQRSRNISGIK